jgi:hypothetical protein
VNKARELRLDDVGFHGEIEAVMRPQGREAVRGLVAPQQLPDGGQPALLADHLQEARGVVAEIALAVS